MGTVRGPSTPSVGCLVSLQTETLPTDGPHLAAVRQVGEGANPRLDASPIWGLGPATATKRYKVG
jgi:hypothetical protein